MVCRSTNKWRCLSIINLILWWNRSLRIAVDSARMTIGCWLGILVLLGSHRHGQRLWDVIINGRIEISALMTKTIIIARISGRRRPSQTHRPVILVCGWWSRHVMIVVRVDTHTGRGWVGDSGDVHLMLRESVDAALPAQHDVIVTTCWCTLQWHVNWLHVPFSIMDITQAERYRAARLDGPLNIVCVCVELVMTAGLIRYSV
jgi:hypothetical protein